MIQSFVGECGELMRELEKDGWIVHQQTQYPANKPTRFFLCVQKRTMKKVEAGSNTTTTGHTWSTRAGDWTYMETQRIAEWGDSPFDVLQKVAIEIADRAFLEQPK